MRVLEDVKLDFEDVLIIPQRSNASSRADISLTRSFDFLYSPHKVECVPIIISNMDAVGTFNMAKAAYKHNILTALHKHYSIPELVEFYRTQESDNTFFTIGLRNEYLEKLLTVHNVLKDLGQIGITKINIDVANGYSKYFVDFCCNVREQFPEAILMAGNICTESMAAELILASKIDIIKAGIGSGKKCFTRKKAGVGYPQLSMCIEVGNVVHGLGGLFVSDGGIVHTCDFAKAFCASADFVMAGSFFAGCDENEGEWEYENNIKNRILFYGSSSDYAMKKHYGKVDSHRTSEGAVGFENYKGTLDDVMQDILGGLRSCGSYIGADEIKHFDRCANFCRVNRVHSVNFQV